VTLARSYNTVAETAALLAEELPSTDERVVAFNAASPADQAVFARQATRDIDAVLWRGRTADEGDDGEDGQALMWPREDGHGCDILPGGELELPAGIDEWSRAGIPGAIRRAAAIQAARNAARARGFDRARAAADLAHVGVTSRSGAGAGTSVDVARATSPWANLDPDAARLCADLRARKAEGI
jgi:hypothetical protein